MPSAPRARSRPRAALAALAFLLAGALLVPSPAAASFDPARGLLLVGTVVTMDAAGTLVEDGRVLVRDGKIVAVWSGREPPSHADVGDAQVVDLGPDARILPGLVNLHAHPAYHVLPLWLAPSDHAQPDKGRPTGLEPYANRYQWNTPSITALEYRRLVSSPRTILQSTLGEGALMVKYAEAMSALAGQTTFEGDGIRFDATDFTLVRNVDFGAFCAYGAPCEDRVTSRVSAISDPSFVQGGFSTILGGMVSGAIETWFVHLAEGVRDEDRPEGDPDSSHDEFELLVQMGLLAEQTTITHGVALEPEDFVLMRAAPSLSAKEPGDGRGARLSWAPLSNLLLYGKTAHVHDALRAGVLVSLGTDWTPSGSRSLLGEMKIADVALRDPRILGSERFLLPGQQPTAEDEVALDREIVAMATRNPAITVRAFDKIGSVEAGKLADLVVLTRPDASPTGGMPASPYREIIDATERDVRLVLVGGNPVAGDEEIMATLKPGDFEVVASERGEFAKAIDVTDPSVPAGDETLADVSSRLAASLAALGGDTPPAEGGPAPDTNTWSDLKQRMDAGRYQSWTHADFLANMKVRWGVDEGRLNLERIALNPLLVEDDALHFAALGVALGAGGKLDLAAPPYGLYPANANHARAGGNPFAESAYESRWYAFVEDDQESDG